MTNVETILQLMRPELNNKQYKTLSYVLETILHPSHCDKSNEELLEQFLKHCKYRNLSPLTVVRYEETLNYFSKLLPVTLAEASTQDLKKLLEDYASRDVKPRTVNAKIVILREFYNYLVNEEYLDINPMSKIPKQKIAKELKGTFTEADATKMRDACTNIRDRALLEFLFVTGVRISELVSLNIGDVNFETRTAFIHQGKGAKDRIVAFDETAEQLIKKYLSYRSTDDSAPLFAKRGTHGELLETRLTSNGVQKWFERMGNQLGIENCHPHTCRHYCITNLIKKDMPIKLVSLQAGHSSISTTLDIYDNQNEDDMIKAYNEAMASK